MTSDDAEPRPPDAPREGRQMGEHRHVEFRNCRGERGWAGHASANERWELRQKAKVACERALDAAIAAEPDDLERLRLGLDAAQLLLQLQPPPWQSHGFMPPAPWWPPGCSANVTVVAQSHGYPYGHAGEGINFATHTAAHGPLEHDHPTHHPASHAFVTDFDHGPPPPTWDDLQAAGQQVTQDDLKLTSDEPSGWLLDADEE